MSSSSDGGGCVLIVLVICAAIALNSVGIAAMFTKSIAIANHQVSMCDRYASADLKDAKAIAVRFEQCMEDFK